MSSYTTIKKGKKKKTVHGCIPPSLQGTLRMIHVSVDQGETWNMAQLPPVGHEQFYSILSANEDMVFMHVDEPNGWSTQKQRPEQVVHPTNPLPTSTHTHTTSFVCGLFFTDTGFGTIYVSDDRGTVYSKSLERHLYTSTGETDFTNVTSLRGVFITSILAEGKY